MRISLEAAIQVVRTTTRITGDKKLAVFATHTGSCHLALLREGTELVGEVDGEEKFRYCLPEKQREIPGAVDKALEELKIGN